MKILIAINGAALTAETFDQYEERYDDTFVVRIWERAAECSHYFQGSMILTGDVAMQGREVAAWVLENTSQGDEIGFVGYSRGGAACIIAAGMLDVSTLDLSRRRYITTIGLFDPVGNQIEADYLCSHTGLPRTRVYIARRDQAFDQGLDSLSFPLLEVNTTFPPIERTFPGSHGDLGGATDNSPESAFEWIAGHLADNDFII